MGIIKDMETSNTGKFRISITLDGVVTVATVLSPLGKAAARGDEALVRELLGQGDAQLKASRLAADAAVVRTWDPVSLCDFLARYGRDMTLADHNGHAISYAGVY